MARRSSHPISRRTFLKTSAKAAVVVAAPFVITRPGWAKTGPVKLGMIEVRSGPNKFIGDGRIAAAEFAVERVNAAGGLYGRKVELVVADSVFKPDVAIRRAKEMLGGEKVDFITGFGAAVGKAVAQVAYDHKKLFICTSIIPPEMMGSEFLPTTVNCALNYDVLARSAAVYCTKAPQAKKIYLLSEDASSGYSAGAAFKKHFEAGKRPEQSIVGAEYHPAFKVTDFAPYITKVMASGADTLFTTDFGIDLRLLLEQGHALGWKLKVVGLYLNSPDLARTAGKAMVGHVTTGINMITLDNPVNRELIKAWRARFPDAPVSHKYPDLATGMATGGFMWLLDVAAKAGSLESEAILKKWEGSKYQAPWGEVEMRACDHQMLSPCGLAELMEPKDIPEQMRFWDFPYIGPATLIAKELISIPPVETGNRRCAKA
jgi:branched-chain amino acid transport system substrate-binding protein